ncbi:MAG: DUF1569 domain-containing protein [Bacteroidetes bacterium]|nr:DUF1569 domain-containing protein [Bacteroidota bacterium]
MNSITSLIDELESKIPYVSSSKESVSSVSVGWHIEHSLLAMIKMIAAVEHSDPANFKSSFNFKRTIIFAIGKFPRGKAKAPESVRPPADSDHTALQPLFEKARQKAALIAQLAPDKYFTHPVFGDLRKKQSLRVFTLHTKHHLQIIADILKK